MYIKKPGCRVGLWRSVPTLRGR